MRKNYFLIIVLLVFTSINVLGQNLRNLSTAEQEQINRLNEMANLYLNDKNLSEAGLSYSRMAFLYWRAGRLREAIDNFTTSADIYMQANKLSEVKNIYSNIAVLYTDLEELEFALEYFDRSLETRRALLDKNEIAAGLIDVAYILQVLGFYDDAIEKLEEALKLAKEQKNARLTLDAYQLLALNHEQNGNIKKSSEYAGKAESYQAFLQEQKLTDELNAEVIRETSVQIEKTEEEKKLAAQILELQRQLYQTAQDSFSIVKSEQDELDRQQQRDIQLLKQEQELSQVKIAQQDLIQKQQEDQQAKQRIVLIAAAGFILLMILIGILMIRANKARKKANTKLAKQNKEIEEKSSEINVALKKIAHQNQSITQSINYAKGIQRALLPKIEKLSDFIEKSFILFRPRDIVSGDFYWFRELDAKSDIFKIFGMHRRKEEEADENVKKKFAISAIDCTGHGVPGAFMSMIGFNLLDEITNKGITRPDLILEELHRGVRTTLKQKETNNQDGMDMALCVIDEENKVVEFAGAKNPLVYVQNGEVHQIKGSKHAIGGKSDDHSYELHKIAIDSPTWIYMFSDGYIDQFGGDNGRKFMIKRFREMLFEIHKKPFPDQNEFLDKVFIDWKGEKYSQIDDVLVIGFYLDYSKN